MDDRQVWIESDDEDDEVWVGLDTSQKTLCLRLSTAEAEQLLEMLVMWQEARRG